INNEPYFEHSDSAEGFSYVRKSRYDRETRLHRTTLEISIGEHLFQEVHVQRAYDMTEIQDLAEQAGFAVESMYDGFSTAPATEESERVHWVLRRPTGRNDA
ncbi:MAG: class I SAM-dependent methyltransferase, partial [Rhodothermales bacterium]